MTDDPAPPWPDRWRPLSVDDLPALTRLENATDAADGERFPTTIDDLASQLLSPTIDLPRMSVVVGDGSAALIGLVWARAAPRR